MEKSPLISHPSLPFEKRWMHLLTLLAAYFLLLAWNGYTYGHGDMIELLPYAKWLNDSTLYPKDFFIQHISHQNINERFILAYFFSWFGKDGMAVVALLLHVLSSLFLLEGLYRIAKRFIQSEGMVWLAILVPFVPLMNWNLGGNEMYIPLLVSSTVAKAMGIWAIYFFLKKPSSAFDIQSSPDLSKVKYKIEEKSNVGWKPRLDKENWFAFILLSFSTFIQPLVGLQLFLVLTGIRVLNVFFDKKTEWQTFLPILFYLLTGGLWIFILQKDFAAAELDNRILFDFLEFRLPHHFIPSYFSKKAAILFLPLFVGALFFYYKKSRDLFLFFVLVLLGVLIYTIGVEFLKSSTIVSSQWFKTTIWLKSVSVIALLSFLENQFSFLQKNIFQKITLWGIRFSGILAILIILNPIGNFKHLPYDFFFLQKKQNNYEIEIAKIAKSKTPKDALFIIPISNTHFKHYSERSTYIDYKAVIHRKAVIPIWYECIQEIYGVDIQTRKSGQDISAIANERFRKLTMEDLNGFSKKGIQYLLTFNEVTLPLKKIGENEKYVIYKLPEF